MADEKITPTPKVTPGGTDTMHSTPETPDRARGEGADAPNAVGSSPDTAPPSNIGSAGAERPGKTTTSSVSSKDLEADGKAPSAGTLVEDFPDMNEINTPDTSPVNPGQEPPPVVGTQPTETREESGKRIRSETKAAEKAGPSASRTSGTTTAKNSAGAQTGGEGSGSAQSKTSARRSRSSASARKTT